MNTNHKLLCSDELSIKSLSRLLGKLALGLFLCCSFFLIKSSLALAAPTPSKAKENLLVKKNLLISPLLQSSQSLQIATATSKKAAPTSKKATDTSKKKEEKEEEDEYRYFEWYSYMGLRFNLSRNKIGDTSPPKFNQNHTGGSLLAGVIGEGGINAYLGFKFLFDIGEFAFGKYGSTVTQNGKKTTTSTTAAYLGSYNFMMSDEEKKELEKSIAACKEEAKKQGASPGDCDDPHFLLRESFFLREAHLNIYFTDWQWSHLKVGAFKKIIGNSFILNSHVLGLSLQFDWSKRAPKKKKPLYIEFDIFLPDGSYTKEGKKSPVANAKISYTFGKKLKLSFFSTYMYDGNNLAGKILLSLWKELFAAQVNGYVNSKTGTPTQFYCDQVYMPREHTVVLQDPRLLQARERAKAAQNLQKDIDNQGFSEEDINNLKKAFPAKGSELASSVMLAGFIDACSTLPSSSGHHTWLGLEAEWKPTKKLTIQASAIAYISKMTVGLPKGTDRFRRKSASSIFNNMSPQWKNRYRKSTQPLLADTSLSTTATQGEGDISNAIKDVSLSGLGFLGALDINYHWTKAFSTKLFFLFATGDTLQKKKSTTNTFMGIIPQVLYTDVFFNGGINSYSSQRGIGVSGISGKGYISPGLTIQYKSLYKDAEEKTIFVFTSAVYWATDLPTFRSDTTKPSRFYGGEINVKAGHNFRIGKKADKWFIIKPVIQLDLFFPSSFFASSNPPTLHYQAIAGADFQW